MIFGTSGPTEAKPSQTILEFSKRKSFETATHVAFHAKGPENPKRKLKKVPLIFDPVAWKINTATAVYIASCLLLVEITPTNCALQRNQRLKQTRIPLLYLKQNKNNSDVCMYIV